MKYQLAASIICAKLIALKTQLKLLEKGRIDRIHFDVMDGVFVPRYGLPPEILKEVHQVTNIPVTVHLMVSDPEPYIEVFAKAGADAFVFHIEPVFHVNRVIKKIKEVGMKAGVALNPATPLSVLDYVLQDLDVVMLMVINPGILGHKLIPEMLFKIADLKNKLKNYPDIKIEIDGGVTSESAPKMIANGADILVCGNSSIFKNDSSVDKTIKEFRRVIEK
ncbi:ribulose-phosphate 3-epimerase [Candidatus Daviesbacteria bacterium]|nr:ribulose-phosphate 3-epimerase [Candidatus Daviesbacteria bacterium]